MTPSDERGIAHDLNNCLHVIRNSIELLSHTVDPANSEALSNLEMARRNLERAAALTQQLLKD